jgi:D-3-phosphoglycerate dehydrogenase
MSIVVTDPYFTSADLENFNQEHNTHIQFYDNVIELAKISNFITLHVPGGDDTKKLVSTEFLSVLKKGTLLINTSRSSIIDEDELIKFVQNNSIYAAVDVVSNEPSEKVANFKHKFADVDGFFFFFLYFLFFLFCFFFN